MMLSKYLITTAALMGFLSVAAGAFGAHALKQKLSPEMLSVFEIGVRYQMYHTFAIFTAVWLSAQFSSDLFLYSGWLFVLGTVIFSGSLYALALTGIKTFGAITPIGGLILLAGWAIMAYGALGKNA